MVSRSDPGSFQRTTTCIWMPDVRLLHYFEPTQWGSVSGLDDGKRKTKRGWSPGDSLNLVRVLSVRVNYSQQCRNDINGRWEYSKSIMNGFRAQGIGLRYYGMCKHRVCDLPAWNARLLAVLYKLKVTTRMSCQQGWVFPVQNLFFPSKMG